MKLQFLQAGEIVTTHGVRGEIKVLPWSDGPDFLMDFRRVRIEGRDYTLEHCRVQKNCNLLKLSGVDSMEDAQALRGKVIEVYRDDAPEGLIFAVELIGMEVLADNQIIGTITDVLDYPGNKVYEVEGAHHYLIPAVKEFILDTDMDHGIMHVKLIEGMRTDEN